jgi:hypothetical protein
VWLQIDNIRTVIADNKHSRSNQGFVVVGTDKLGEENIWIGDDGKWVFDSFGTAMDCRLFVQSRTLEIIVKPLEAL